MYSFNVFTTYAVEENGEHSAEVHIKDSDGADICAYADGKDLLEVINNLAEELEDAMADLDDEAADKEEAKIRELREKEAVEKARLEEEAKKQAEIQKTRDDLNKQIADLQAKLAALDVVEEKVNDFNKANSSLNTSIGNKISKEKLSKTNAQARNFKRENSMNVPDLEKMINKTFEKFFF